MIKWNKSSQNIHKHFKNVKKLLYMIDADSTSRFPLAIPIIGIHHSPLSQKFGIPRQPNLVKLSTQIEMLPPYSASDAFTGIEEFSHLWITWQFHQNKPQTNFRPKVRPPRLGGNNKLGVFATRSMYRPSNLGLSVVQLERVEVTNGKVFVHILGADMVDNTPIIDIKPYVCYSDSIPDAMSGFAGEKPQVKSVIINLHAQSQIENLIAQNKFSLDDIEHIQSLIAQDPRPAYRQHEIETEFIMRYACLDVIFSMNSDHELVIKNLRIVDSSDD